MGRAGSDVDVTNVQIGEVPVEPPLELGAVVRRHDMDAKRQAADDVVDDPTIRASSTINSP